MKTELIQMRVTPKQKQTIQQQSAALGLSVSQYLLMLAMRDFQDNKIKRN